jgi:hypothetical protein
MDATFARGSKEQYRFAMAALEAAMPSESSGPKAYATGWESHRQKTFVVTYRSQDGKMHTVEIRAATAADAKQKVRENNHPRARFTEVKEK